MERPADDVVAAFGGDPSALVRLAGGRGESWRAGSVVLKPVDDDDVAEAALGWLAGFVGALVPDGAFRVAGPIAVAKGGWTTGGWWATSWLEGSHVPGAWDRVLEVSAAFHRAAAAATVVAGVAWPEVFARRRDPWSVADRVAWAEQAPDDAWPASVRHVLQRLRPLLDRPSPDASQQQVVHGDLGGNVLFADDAGLPPAVIDISPYWRPAAYADAIVVADAVAWDGAPLTLAVGFAARRPDDGDELLARAIAFRTVTAAVNWQTLPDRVDAEVAAYAPMLALLRS
jgi:uncharacterized protein (TIGR02569 family)